MPTGLSRKLKIILAISLLITAALALDLSPLLRGGAGWRWPYEAPIQPIRLLPGVLALIAYLGIGLKFLDRPDSERSPHGYLLTCLIGGLMVQLALLSFYGNPIEQLFNRTVSTLSGGFYEVGVEIDDLDELLRNYPDHMPDWSAHPRAHPPGTIMTFWLTREVFALSPALSDGVAAGLRPNQCHHRVLMSFDDASISAAWIGMLLPLLGLLSIYPAYDLTRRLSGAAAARRVALWLPLIPGFLMFSPQFNQVHMLFTMTALWMLHRGLSERRLVFFALTGLVLSVASWQSFTVINLIGLLGLYGLAYIILVGRHEWNRGDWKQIIIGVGVAGLGLASIWIAYYIYSGYTPFDLLSTALNIHYELQEPYLPWLFFFPMDLTLFTGIGFMLLAMVAGVESIRSAIRDRHIAQPDSVLPIAVLLAVVALTASGVSRGEVGRLMIVIMPAILIAAVVGLRDEIDNAIPISVVLGLQVIVMVAVLRVIGTGLAAPPTYQPPISIAEVAADADFGEARLVGYTAHLDESGEALDLTLYWESTGRFDQAYFVGGIVIAPDGSPVGVLDWLPVEGAYPTSCWEPGQLIEDRILIPLSDATPGDYWLSISLFDFDTGERVSVRLPDGSVGDQVGLGPIVLP